MPAGLMALVTVVMHMVSAQDRGSTILRQGESHDVQSEIVTSRTRAFLSCESGEMVVRVNFTEPFRGLMYAHKARLSPCRINGFGSLYYELRIPLKGCGTWQESPRVFVNNVTIRFHRALELEEDETKTVVCRYPPPHTPPPGGIIQIISPSVTPSPSIETTRLQKARLSEVEILIIICLLLFLSLLTLGIGIAYFCLKRRNIHIIRSRRKGTSSSGPASQLTKLSSYAGTHAPTSVLSSTILDHTVRIPRAVPYSASLRTASGGPLTASDHDYYENPSATPTSRDSLESSPSTSTTSDESVGGTRQLLHYKGGPRSNLTIPKAILRKDDIKRHTLASVHHYFSSRAASALTKNRMRGELEDQTVTTVLEPELGNEDTSHWDFNNSRASEMTSSYDVKTFPRAVPVYAQIEKKKHRVRILEGAQVMQSEGDDSRYDANGPDNKKSKNFSPVPGMAKRQVTIDKPVGFKNMEEVVKNTTTSVLRTTTKSKFRSISPMKLEQTKEDLSNEDKGAYLKDDPDHLRFSDIDFVGHNDGIIPPGNVSYSVGTSSQIPKDDGPLQVLEGRNLYVKDIDDIYITTTVETESTELRTMISRDTVEEHIKNRLEASGIKEHKKDLTDIHAMTKDRVDTKMDTTDTSKESPSDTNKPGIKGFVAPSSTSVPLVIPLSTNVSNDHRKNSLSSSDDFEDKQNMASLTDNWNVIIRQRKPQSPITDVDKPSSEFEDDTSKTSIPPKFDVIIRTIPPKKPTNEFPEASVNRKQSTELVTIPKLQMPRTIEKIRDIMTKLEAFSSEPQKTALVQETNMVIGEDSEKPEVEKAPEVTSQHQLKTVWWSDNSAPQTTTRSSKHSSTLSSSESFQSEDSLRERSSSEVLEKVPTLFNRRDSDHPMLERSTSEIVTSPEDHVRWTESAPIFESFSPEFLANIPVVTQGGFFHGTSSPTETRKPPSV